MMKKSLTFFVLLILAISITISASAVTIEMWAMNNAPSEKNIAWFKARAKEFEKETGIKVKFNEIGWGEVMQKIPLALSTGEGANVMQVGTTQNPFFADTGGLVKIDIDEFGGAEAYMPANLISTTLDGKYYGVPWFAETRLLFYNTKMFEEAGVERPPQTWTELVKVGEKIVDVYGEGSAMAMAGTSAWDLIHNYAILLWSNGGEILDDNYTEAKFNSEAGIEAMKYYVELVRKGLADEACAEYNQPQADSAFINGDVAMVIMGPWNIAGIENDNPDLPYAIAPPPAGPEGRNAFSGGSNLIIRKNAPVEEIEASKKWIKFITNKNNLVDYTKNLSHMLPAKSEAFNDPYYESGKWKVFKNTLQMATAYPPLPEWAKIEQAIVANFNNVLTAYVNGNYDENTVKEYMDTAAEEVNNVLSE